MVLQVRGPRHTTAGPLRANQLRRGSAKIAANCRVASQSTLAVAMTRWLQICAMRPAVRPVRSSEHGAGDSSGPQLGDETVALLLEIDYPPSGRGQPATGD